MDTLNFYDMKAKKKFSSSSYKVVKKGKRRFAVAISPDNNEAWRIIGNEKP